MLKSPLTFGIALLAAWVMLATGALTSLAGVAPFANPRLVVSPDVIEVVAPPPALVHAADASVPQGEAAAPARSAEPAKGHATL